MIEEYPWDKSRVVYKELSDKRRFMGVYVTASGHVFKPDGTQIPPKPIFRTLKDGSKTISSVNIEYMYNGERVCRGYQRFVYAAFNEDFDINDTSKVVVSTTGNQFEIRVKYLEAISRREHHKRVADKNRKFNEEERKKIAETFWRVEGKISKRQVAEELDISEHTLNKILEEYPNERN